MKQYDWETLILAYHKDQMQQETARLAVVSGNKKI